MKSLEDYMWETAEKPGTPYDTIRIKRKELAAMTTACETIIDVFDGEEDVTATERELLSSARSMLPMLEFSDFEDLEVSIEYDDAQFEAVLSASDGVDSKKMFLPYSIDREWEISLPYL